MSAAEKNGIIKAFEQEGVKNLNLHAGFPLGCNSSSVGCQEFGLPRLSNCSDSK